MTEMEREQELINKCDEAEVVIEALREEASGSGDDLLSHIYFEVVEVLSDIKRGHEDEVEMLLNDEMDEE